MPFNRPVAWIEIAWHTYQPCTDTRSCYLRWSRRTARCPLHIVCMTSVMMILDRSSQAHRKRCIQTDRGRVGRSLDHRSKAKRSAIARNDVSLRARACVHVIAPTRHRGCSYTWRALHAHRRCAANGPRACWTWSAARLIHNIVPNVTSMFLGR